MSRRQDFEQYHLLAAEFCRTVFNYHYTEFVITEETKLSDYAYVCVEGLEHTFSSRDEFYAEADKVVRQRILKYYDVQLDERDYRLYEVFDLILHRELVHWKETEMEMRFRPDVFVVLLHNHRRMAVVLGSNDQAQYSFKEDAFPFQCPELVQEDKNNVSEVLK